MTDVLVVGESLVDIVQRADGTSVEYAGGSAANVAVALARLGRPVAFVTAYAHDERGAVLARHLNQSAVALVGDPHALERTATALATLAADGSASYTFDIDWRLNPVPEVSPVVVHTCSLGAVLSPGAADVRRLLERLRPTATISYDVNARPAVTGTGPDVVARRRGGGGARRPGQGLRRGPRGALSRTTPSSSPSSVCSRLGPSAVVVTRGRDGATWFHAGGRVDAPSTDVEVVRHHRRGRHLRRRHARRTVGARVSRRPPHGARRLRHRGRSCVGRPAPRP